jgi:1-deoxyxylulose-5-phosphate synthase
MEYVRLGYTGLKISRIALGCTSDRDPARGLHSWALDEAASEAFFKQAVELGSTFWDTANVYQAGSSEEFVGRATRSTHAGRRSWWPRRSPGRCTTARRPGLSPRGDHGAGRRLDTDCLDLYLIHRFDPDNPVEETMETLHHAVMAGRAATSALAVGTQHPARNLIQSRVSVIASGTSSGRVNSHSAPVAWTWHRRPVTGHR